jgi:hypothetical protein
MTLKRPSTEDPAARPISQRRRVSAMHLIRAKRPIPAVESYSEAIPITTTRGSLPPVASHRAVEKVFLQSTHIEAKALVGATYLRDALEDRKTAIIGETLDLESRPMLDIVA